MSTVVNLFYLNSVQSNFKVGVLFLEPNDAIDRRPECALTRTPTNIQQLIGTVALELF